MNIEATIQKADITPLGALKGFANADPIAVDGGHFGRGHIVFNGFVGHKFPDGLWHGVLVFTAVDGDVPVKDFSELQRIMHGSEVSDELHSDGN